jgi:hypothetical protein
MLEISRCWAMPNKWTFLIPPIADLLKEEVGAGLFQNKIWLDPFAGQHSPAQIRNDLNPNANAQTHLDARTFLRQQKDNSVDGVLFDPPYSPRQIKEVYEGIGTPLTGDETNMSFWSDCKNEISRIITPGGKVICFGWNSMGLGKGRGFEMTKILLVAHGGSKNDTICTVETKLGATS